MKIALASPSVALSLDDGLEKVRRLQSDAAAQDAEIICFPEAYLPGLRGQDFEVFSFGPGEEARVIEEVSRSSREFRIATILGMEKVTNNGRQIIALVIDANGQIQGYQTKNQLDPSEDQYYVPGKNRRLFEINGVKFGIAICHEGWRYPETVRWAAVRGAKIVFHPQRTGSNTRSEEDAPYYEKAMMCRSIENTIYFASVNYALQFQDSLTSLIDPSGQCQAYLPYGTEGVLVEEIDIQSATGLIALRFAPERYEEDK